MSKFYKTVDLGCTALLLSDIQEQILQRFPPEVVGPYLETILKIVSLFREEIARRRSRPEKFSIGEFDAVPLIVHHVLPFGINSNAFVSPYNKLSSWVNKLESSGYFNGTASDPNHPHYAIPNILRPAGGWGLKDEIILPKIQPGCFSSSDLLAYFRARGIKHVVLCGLTTSGSVLGSARLGADLDFHVIVLREGVMDDDSDVNTFILERVFPKFVDVVAMRDMEELFQ